MKNSFYLVIPPQQANAERIKMFEDVALERWISELPTANPGLSVKLLRDLLEEFISLQMDAQMRLNAAEKLRPCLYTIQDYLRSRLMLAGFPKTANDLKTFDALVEIQRPFAIAYWVVVKELTWSRAIGWLKARNLALSLERVIKSLSDIVISYFLMAVPLPDWVWIDLHSLYKLSVKFGKENTKVPDDTAVFSKSSSPLDSYLRVILLGLSEPSGLMQKEIILVYQFFEKLIQYVVLESKPVAGQGSQCVILMDEDKPPLWMHNATSYADSHVIYVNFSKLLKVLSNADNFVNSKDSRFSSMSAVPHKAEKVSSELLEYLKARWSGINASGAPLFGDRMGRYFSIGLDHAHDLQYSLDRVSSSDVEYFAESGSERSLSCKFEKRGLISVGSLITFRRQDVPEHKRSLGVISKIPITKADGRVDFEIKHLAVQVHAVNYLPIDAEQSVKPHKALIYGVKEGNEEKSFLIIESFLYKDEDVLRLFIAGENFPIVLRDRKNIGLGYWQFECRRIPEQLVAKAGNPKKG